MKIVKIVFNFLVPKYLSREHLDEVEIPDIDMTNFDNATLGCKYSIL